MPSRFGWVDFAERDRQQMLDVIGMFGEQETRDELGIGTIRDAYANYFFPGTSTIQTRARYMLFVPWIYLNLERRRVGSSRMAQLARRDEVRLIYALLESGDLDGLIGKQAKEKLQRLPSNIYWSGLGSWGIRLFPGSQGQYHDFADAFVQRELRTVHDDDGEPVAGAVNANWDPGLPEPPENLLAAAEFALTREEAKYLRDRVLMAHRTSLLACILVENRIIDALFVWEHPVANMVGQQLREDIAHARNFSETMHGAPLLYNWMLAEKLGSEELKQEYRVALDEWLALLAERDYELRQWNQHRDRFWSSPALQLAQISRSTARFVEEWFGLAFQAEATDDLLLSRRAQQLIHDREVRLKGARSRLEHRRQLELWSGHAGTLRLDYRWSTAKTLVRDILLGLKREDDERAETE